MRGCCSLVEIQRGDGALHALAATRISVGPPSVSEATMRRLVLGAAMLTTSLSLLECGSTPRPVPLTPSSPLLLIVPSPPPVAVGPPAASAEAALDDAPPVTFTLAPPRGFELRLTFADGCESDGSLDACEGAADVSVLRKSANGDLELVQSLTFENVHAWLDATGQPIVNTAKMYGLQGVVNVGDFDFDGHDDFAVYVGDDGPYGGPTYDVFLYSPFAGSFDRSEALSQLTRETLGFFGVDSARRQLTSMAKSGCCFHVWTRYAVVAGEPVPVESHTEALDAEADALVVTDGRRIGKRWVETEHATKLAGDAGAN
jgi:hypothetical protein